MARHQQLTLALDAGTRARLEQTAKREGRSLGDEIRRRIERTLSQDALLNEVGLSQRPDLRFETEDQIRYYIERAIAVKTRFDDNYDGETQWLGEAIMMLARDVRFSDEVTWRHSTLVYQALVVAVTAYLAGQAPAPQMLIESDDLNSEMRRAGYPEVFGRTVAIMRLRDELPWGRASMPEAGPKAADESRSPPAVRSRRPKKGQ
jgi:hypothetical protein